MLKDAYNAKLLTARTTATQRSVKITTIFRVINNANNAYIDG